MLKTLAGCMPQIPLNPVSDKSPEQCLNPFGIRMSPRNFAMLRADHFAKIESVILQPSPKTK
jgi:hypothetical protein